MIVTYEMWGWSNGQQNDIGVILVASRVLEELVEHAELVKGSDMGNTQKTSVEYS